MFHGFVGQQADETGLIPTKKSLRPLRLCGLIISVLLLFSLNFATFAQSSRIDELLNSMTIEQKVAQMFLVGLYGDTLNEPSRDFIDRWQPGGVVLFVSNAGTPEQVTRLTNSWQQTIVDAGGVPMFIATDQEGGVIARLKDGFTEWPVPMLLTASGDLSLAQAFGSAQANELKSVGINMNLAPVADLYTNLNNPVIGRRSYGSDPTFTGRMLAAVVRGLQAGGVMATAKHFPGHGDTNSDSHTSLPVVDHTREELDQIELEPFRWTISAGVEAMMLAHIWYPALEPERELPASLSYNVATTLLRDEMGFRGLSMTDAIEMDAIDTRYSYEDAAIRAINAGIDVVAFGAHTGPETQGRTIQAVIDAVKRGDISEARIDDSVRRILDTKARYGVLDWSPLEIASTSQRMNSAENAKLVDSIFQSGVTLAYDNGGFVPIQYGQRVAVVYPGTQNSIKTSCEQLTSVAQVTWIPFNEGLDNNGVNAIANQVASADVIVSFSQENSVDSNSAQARVIDALPAEKTIAVGLFSPYVWQNFPDVAAYMTTYSPLSNGYAVVCDILAGVRTANGQLPIALDGVRDFRESVIQVERTVVALAPTITPPPTSTGESVEVVALDINTANSQPLPTATITPTLAPLGGATRVANVPPANNNAASAQDIATLVTPEIFATATQIVAQGGASNSAGGLDIGQAISDVFGGGEGVNTVSVIAGGIIIEILLMVALYWWAYRRASRRANRYKQGFVIDHCPVCGDQSLRLRKKTSNAFGLPRSKYTVHCVNCNSILREESPGQWRYRVNSNVNMTMYERFNGKLIDNETLRLLEQEWRQYPRR